MLLGFMGAGKTTVGQILASRLGWTFLDTDALVEARLGLPVDAIFAKLGEESFRKCERDVVTDAVAESGTVIATGGGWPEPEGTVESLPPATLSVWLRAPPEELLRRAQEQQKNRPLLDVADPIERTRRLLERRAPRYARAQMHLMTAGKDPATVADAIARRVSDQAQSERPKTT